MGCYAMTRPANRLLCCAVLCCQVFVAQGRRRRAESTILESESLIKALQQQSELDNKSLAAIIQVRQCGGGLLTGVRLPRVQGGPGLREA